MTAGKKVLDYIVSVRLSVFSALLSLRLPHPQSPLLRSLVSVLAVGDGRSNKYVFHVACGRTYPPTHP